MDANDVDKMPAGRELDALVASKVMGLVRHKWKEGQIPTCNDECDPDESCNCTATTEGLVCSQPGCSAVRGKGWESTRSPEDFCRYQKQYSTDIAAAWEVVEKLRERFGAVGIHYRAHDPEQIDPYWEAGCAAVMYEYTYKAEAHTAPLAICRAALKAVGLGAV